MEPAVASGSTSSNPQREYTRADLDEIPDTQVAEIIDGRLYVSPRPRFWHGRISTIIAATISRAYDPPGEGLDGWWILVEPGIELPNAPEIVPDVAGWRRSRMPVPPTDSPIQVAPDWVCEVHSPGTWALDIRKKKPFYARAGVEHLWLVDIPHQALSVSRLVNGAWTDAGDYGENDRVRVKPFEGVEIALANWWPSTK